MYLHVQDIFLANKDSLSAMENQIANLPSLLESRLAMVASEHPRQHSRVSLAMTNANQDAVGNRGAAVNLISPAPIALHPKVGPSAMCLRATIRTRKCPRFCRCRCHVHIQLSTPRWMKSILGSFFGSFMGCPLLLSQSCDYSRCRQSGSSSTEVRYIFPVWFVKRAIVFSTTWRDLSGLGASWTFRMPRVIDTRSDVWLLIERGSLSRLRECLERHKASPYDVVENGWTLLHVRMSASFSIWITPRSSSWASER